MFHCVCARNFWFYSTQVLVRNLTTNIVRPARTFVLDPPNIQSSPRNLDLELPNSFVPQPNFYPTFTVHQGLQFVDCQVAYLSSPLAFNIGLHVTWLTWLIKKASTEAAASLSKSSDKTIPELESIQLPTLELYPLLDSYGEQLPKSTLKSREVFEKFSQGLTRYASHVRIGHIRTPASLNLSNRKDYVEQLKKERQERIDKALAKYFEVDRLLAEGDILSLWLPPAHSALHASFGDLYTPVDELIHFKVLTCFPSLFLWIDIISYISCFGALTSGQSIFV